MDSSHQNNNPHPDDDDDPPDDNNNHSKNNSNKKGKGRENIPIEKIENEINKQYVTFLKRQAGLFEKASELSSLCGAESVSVVFSPGDKAYSFGSPNVETITNRFLNQTDLPRNIDNNNDQALASRTDSIMHQQNQLLTNLESQVEVETKSKKEGKKIQKANRNIKEMSPSDLEELNYQALDVIKRFVMCFKQAFDTQLQNPMGPENPYVQGSNPDTGIGGDFPLTTALDGPSLDFTMDPNIHGPSYMANLYGNEESMNTGNPPLVPGGSSNYPNQFDIGSSINSNYAFPNNSGQSNPSATFFYDMLTTNNPGFVNPFDQMAGNNIGLPFNSGNPTTTRGLNPIRPFNYGNPTNIVTYDTETEGTSTIEARREGRGRERQNSFQDKSKGINNRFKL